MTRRRWLLYGANGYTGRLIAERAAGGGDPPVLAGRSAEKLAPLGAQLGLETRAVALDDAEALRRALVDVDAVLHAAGPYSRTSAPMVDACLATGTSYLDITGELGVFEAILARDGEAKAAGVALVPGVGFDVVPTDCLAATLAAALPGATELVLAFHSKGGVSPGTTKTTLESIPDGDAWRAGGALVRGPAARSTREIPFHDKPRFAVGIPWGDVCTAWHSTGIPDIRVYMAMSPGAVKRIRRMSLVAPLLRWGPLLRLMEAVVTRRVHGPDEAARETGFTEVWGEVRDAEGTRVTGTVRTPEAYTFTADAALAALRRVLADAPKGAFTPSKAFGADFVTTIPGVELREILRG